VLAFAALPAAAGPDGGALYRAACAACHGDDGRGRAAVEVGFAEPLPDFTDCSFATREPDADWLSITRGGGPVRGFARMMPAFGAALGAEEQEAILGHVRGFCGEAAWPRGELNLPRPLITEKAYPEDELVWTTGVGTGDEGSVSNELLYEKRFGARNQVELVLPIDWVERPAPTAASPGETSWTGGVGDMAVAVKRAVWHDHRRGSIFSVIGEVILPTGDDDRGLGKGYAVFEPFVAFGQLLPRDAFLHVQTGLELPLDDDADDEAFARLALGRSWVEGRWGRTWSPMVELLASRELVSGATLHWDAVPQVQVTLNTRQHVMLNVGVRLPLNDTAGRDPTLLAYLLWDWFDGGFFQGW